MTSKYEVKAVCRNLSTTGNRKQRRAQEVIAYKKVLKHMRKSAIMKPDATAMDADTIGSAQEARPLEAESV